MRSDEPVNEESTSDLAPSDQPFSDQLSLVGQEADVYEAIATLEFLGRPVHATDIAGAARLDGADVDSALAAMTERGIVVRTGDGGDPAYAPAHRGWSAAPEQPAGPQR